MTNRSKRRTFLKGAASTVTIGLAGCTGGGGGGDGNGGDGGGGDGGDGGGAGSPTATSTSSMGGEMDFGGEEISVMLNVGSISEVHKKFLIPKMEEKYNLTVNSTESVTTQQLTKIQANQDNPPDVIIPDVIGIEKASRNDWLEPISDHEDIVTNWGDIYDKFKHYGDTGVSWEVGEVVPVINTNAWDSTPTSYDQLMKESSSVGLVPFSWSGGPYLLLMAAAVATGEDFSSPDLDVQAGFDYLEENLKPNVKTEYQGVASAKQQLASGNFDSILVFWDYMVFDMFLNNAPVETVFRPDPVGIAFAETVAVPKGASNMKASMAYVNECLSVEFQEQMSGTMGAGVTNKNAEVDDKAKEFGAATADDFDDLAFPDFRTIWENRDAWSESWAEIFSG